MLFTETKWILKYINTGTQLLLERTLAVVIV